MDADLSVIKVGGSLLGWPELPRRLTAFLAEQRARSAAGRFVLLAGGGAAADLVRSLDRHHQFDDETAHDLAIRAMDLTARLLAAVLPDATPVEQLADCWPAWNAGRIPVLVPTPIVRHIERQGSSRLPRSWDTTSDSIAAWIAGYLRADCLILLKSASLPLGAGRRGAALLERVDPNFPRISRGIPRVRYLNLRDPSTDLVALDWDDSET
jgi:aspartokinase-like uncharacterized kinase